ncbi:MAG TPA: isoprenylcysteine carboxylmethyltransferase family protein [Usitatibacter sp.]|jgi:protein-S-isoprenylcysteine O-methyltransferase|nr:isoprenylcysteine carboxylmethyltransferase family protein [Usitatibacter sp.]
MGDWFNRLWALPSYGIGGVAILLLYVVQAEVRFGARARSHSTGPADRGSSVLISVASLFPILGLTLAMKAPASAWIPAWFRAWTLPGMPAVAWAGVAIGAVGLAVRLWSVLTLRERYTRTLLTHDQHSVERSGPYRWVRHPGYLGSLLALNGIAMASGNGIVLLASLLPTLAAYSYRIRVEDEMLVAALGEEYDAYRREVGALSPLRLKR